MSNYDEDPHPRSLDILTPKAEPKKLDDVLITPLFDRVLVMRSPEKEFHDKGGRLAVADAYKEKPVEGQVLAIGGAVTNVKVGDVLLFGKYSGINLPDEYGKDLVMMREEEILGFVHRQQLTPTLAQTPDVEVIRSADPKEAA